MAKLNSFNKKYTDRTLTVGSKWLSFDNASGAAVENFIKDKLENSVVDFEYKFEGFENDGSTIKNALIGKNAFGESICYTPVINANPSYTVDFAFINIEVGTQKYNPDSTALITINKSNELEVYTTFKCLITGNIAGNTFNETSAQKVTFKWFKDKNGTQLIDGSSSYTTTVLPGESIRVPITTMYQYPLNGAYLGIVIKPVNSEEVTYVFNRAFSIRELKINYKGNLFIQTDENPTLVFKIDGTENESLAGYTLDYKLDTGSLMYEELSENNNADNIILPLSDLSEGSHDLCIRIRKGNLTSEYIQITFLYQKINNSNLTSATAIVTEVPNQISNCDLIKFFKVITTDKLSGDVEIVALKSSTRSALTNITTVEQAKLSEYCFKEINLNFLNSDAYQTIGYTSYIEIPNTTNSNLYFKFFIKDNNGEKTVKFLSYSGTSPSLGDYKQISVVNPIENISDIQYTKGEILNFSQISNGNVFTDLNATLDNSDGIQLETLDDSGNQITLTTFKTSPIDKIFNLDKKLYRSSGEALGKNDFSIEMMFKTYGVNDLDDEILSIGNITLCPKHLFLKYNPEINSTPDAIVNASRADFMQEELQHVIITYDPAYKPKIYDNLYDMFYSGSSSRYTTNAVLYPCLKIYVNGTINRVISVDLNILGDPYLPLQIHPKNSNINFYIFRTYDKALTYNEIQKNYISSLFKLDDKTRYRDDNDILYLEKDFAVDELNDKQSILNTISLGKCINNFKSVSNPDKNYTDRKVLLLALPNGKLPPYYGNRSEKAPKATFLVHYPKVLSNDTYIPAKESGRLSGGKVKAQGSSAKKYMFHNTSYSKFTFTPESEFDSDSPKTYDYYKMPTSDIAIKKLVGKVNYASSMQSHKQGATKLFHEGYVQEKSGLDTSWMNGGRKAVLEDDFLYFFVNVPEEKLETLTWDYFKLDDGTYNFENCYFLGFQTWGSAKGDEPTSGYNDATPHYLMLEGADNDNSSANFKTPWASMLIWGNYNEDSTWGNATSTRIERPTDKYVAGNNYYHQFSGKDSNSNPDYFSGLLINDETIVFDPGVTAENSSDKRADAWDVDFGATEGKGYDEDYNPFFEFKPKVKESVKRFAEFYNLVYMFDFSSLFFIGDNQTIDGYSMLYNESPIYHRKLIFGEDCTITYGNEKITPKAGDIYRWEKGWTESLSKNTQSKWVPAGLYYDTNNHSWEDLNIIDICNLYYKSCQKNSNIPEYCKFFGDTKYDDLRADGNNNTKLFVRDYSDAYITDDLRDMQACMAEAFKIIVSEYMDVNDVAYHQAFIKLISGTDNRAKNTYFQIVGPIYTDKASIDDSEVSIVKVLEGDYADKVGYITGDLFYEVTIDNDGNVEDLNSSYSIGEISTKPYYYKQSGVGDYKIRLYLDDLDTIFKTDNNGLQVKPYHLMEPPFNTDLEHLWGDLHSGFFYNFDLVFVDDVKNQLSNLLEFSTKSYWPDNANTKFYEYFFSVLKNLPSISYNHQSEIYYESAQTLFNNGGVTNFYNSIANSESWKDFNNNKVKNPVSLSHGSCIEAEIEYLRNRILLLSTYTNSGKKYTDSKFKIDTNSVSSLAGELKIESTYTSFIQYIYPLINDKLAVNTHTGLNYDEILDYITWDSSNQKFVTNRITNVALPNTPVNLNVTFETSGLTQEFIWGNTDLYKTLHIKSGLEAFTEFINFPNASTVIVQDSKYKINKYYGSDLTVYNYLRSVEHLVLQDATFSCEGLNLLNCNRLKTLILGTTLDTLQIPNVLNNGEIDIEPCNGSSGFTRIILPRSNNLSTVLLPNCIKEVNIGYYPKLSLFEFNEGTELHNLTIDGRNDNVIIESILSKFTGTYTNILEINNIPDGFWLSENTCRKLAQIDNVKISGTINIGVNKVLTNIKWDTKKMLIEKFGKSVTFNYQTSPIVENGIVVDTTSTIESSGIAPIGLEINGNDIPIDTDGKHLKIYYSISTREGAAIKDDSIKFVDKHTPELIIKSGLEGTYKITTTIYYGNTYTTRDTIITVGFYVPNVGDFAYADGSFNSSFDSKKGLVGIVFYSKLTEDSNTLYDIRVLSAKASSTDLPLSPSKYAVNWDTIYGGNASLKDSQKQYIGFLTNLRLDPDKYVNDVVLSRDGGEASGVIYYDTKWSNTNIPLHEYKLPNISERNNQLKYLELANNYLFAINLEGINIPNTLGSNITSNGKQLLDTAMQILKDTNHISAGGEGYDRDNLGTFGYLYGLYPAFLQALYYEPKANLSNKGIDYYSIGHWYIPDSREIERIIYYRINSSIQNTTDTQKAWNSDNASTNIINKDLAVFKSEAFANIAFLKDTSNVITANGTSSGTGLAYGNSASNELKWSTSTYVYYSLGANMCGRDKAHNIYPVCRIVLTKE